MKTIALKKSVYLKKNTSCSTQTISNTSNRNYRSKCPLSHNVRQCNHKVFAKSRPTLHNTVMLFSSSHSGVVALPLSHSGDAEENYGMAAAECWWPNSLSHQINLIFVPIKCPNG